MSQNLPDFIPITFKTRFGTAGGWTFPRTVPQMRAPSHIRLALPCLISMVYGIPVNHMNFMMFNTI